MLDSEQTSPRVSLHHERSSAQPRKVWLLYALPLLVVLVALWATQIGGSPVEKDEQQTVQLALNLWHDGVMSMEATAPFLPSMQREPLPIATTALSVGLIDAVMGRGPRESYLFGARAAGLRIQNVLWFAFLCAVMFGVIYQITSDPKLAALGAALTGLLPFMPGVVFRVDQLDTEAIAAVLLVLSSYWLALGVIRQRWSAVVLAGLGLGLLALVKAATLYIFAGVLATLLVACTVGPLRKSMGWGLKSLAMLAVSFAIVVVPWMMRNHTHFGTFELANRAGGVLYTRALKDMMTPTEYVGAFYAWAQWPLRGITGRMLGFTRQDLMLGGRLQRLNRNAWADFADHDLRNQMAGRPDLTISFYRTSQAEMVRVRNELGAADDPDVTTDAERIVRKKALQIIREHPWRHLAMTIPCLWRGAAVTFPLLILAFAYAIRRSRYDLALFVLPAFGTVAFYALLTHFIPRYGAIPYPVAIAAACLMFASWRESKRLTA